MNKVQESLSTGKMLDVASVEMAVTSIANVKSLLTEAWAHVKKVQEELDSIGEVFTSLALHPFVIHVPIVICSEKQEAP